MCNSYFFILTNCYNYFKNIPNLDKFNEIPIPKTEYQENLKQLELSPPEQFIRELVVNETKESIEIKSKDIYILNSVLGAMRTILIMT